MCVCAKEKMLNTVTMEQYGTMPDEKLIEMIRGDVAETFSVLVSRYEEFLRFKVSKFNPEKAQYDDYMQEAILSFFTAVKTFDESKSLFCTYLNVCVTRALISLDRKTKRRKVGESVFEDELYQLPDGNDRDPLNLVEAQERVDTLVKDIRKMLSKFELKALILYLGGNSYECIATKLGTTTKSVDNAMQRVRFKLKSRK